MGVIVPAGSAGRAQVEGYDPKTHDPYFDGVTNSLADKGQLSEAAPLAAAVHEMSAAQISRDNFMGLAGSGVNRRL